MVVACLIEFDQNPYGTYFAGQIMTGKVTLQTDKVKQVKGVALKIYGFAHTNWTEQNNPSTTNAQGQSNTQTSSTWFTGHEDYIASITYLLGSDAAISVNIEPGIHTYNFSSHIPNVCPTSFEGTFGHIRYIIKVELQRPWKYDQTFTKGFTVLKMMDLNYDSPILNVPANSESYKTFCCGPCKSDPLKISVSIPQSGYVPGQMIPVDVLIANESNVKVEEIKVSLAMLVCYYSQSPVPKAKQERISMAKLKSEGILPNCTKNYAYDLPVPATPPTCFNLCRIIQIAYQIEVEAKIKGMHTNQVVCLPVTIGNVPLMKVIQLQPISNAGMRRERLNAATLENSNGNVQQSFGQHNNDINAMTTETEVTAPEMPWSADPTIPPPSYEEAVHMKRGNIIEGETHDYGENDFAPRYPVFSIPSPIPVNTDECTGGYVNSNNNDPDKSTWL